MRKWVSTRALSKYTPKNERAEWESANEKQRKDRKKKYSESSNASRIAGKNVYTGVLKYVFLEKPETHSST